MDEKVNVFVVWCGNEKICCRIKRGKRRRTVAVQVAPCGEVTVYAPRFAGKDFLRKFVRKRADWILKKQKVFREMEEKFPPKEFVNGESFPLFGRNYRLEILRAKARNGNACKINGKRFQVFLNGQANGSEKENVKRALSEFYAKQTQHKVSDIIRRYAPSLGVMPEVVKIVNQLRRWGSCSAKGNIRLNWRLSMMPVSVLTYIVVHELCHLKVRNHSERFWRTMKSVLPDYEMRRAWLNENSGIVSFLDCTT